MQDKTGQDVQARLKTYDEYSGMPLLLDSDDESTDSSSLVAPGEDY